MSKDFIIDDNGYIKVTGCVLKLLKHCKAKDSTRYAINKVLISDKKSFVTTDGRSLAIVDTGLTKAKMGQCILTKAAC